MERTVLTFPVKPGSSPEQIHSISDMFLARPKEYRESRSRLGITLERVYHQPTPMGDFVNVYAESRDPAGQTVGMMAMSDLAIDKDFVRLVNEIHGMDLTVPPAGPPSGDHRVVGRPGREDARSRAGVLRSGSARCR